MAVIRVSNEADLTFEAGSYTAGELRVVRFSGSEEISRPFEFDIELVSEDSQIDFDAIIGKPALLTIRGDQGDRWINGIVGRFEQKGSGRRFTRYNAGIVPGIWLLQHREKSRIFQNQDVKEIIEKVLKDANIPADRYRFALKNQYQPREYCVQYRESDLDFISRLMEEEGIFYFFEHTDKKHVLVMGDSPTANVVIPSPDTVVYNEPTGGIPEEESIYKYSFVQEVRSGAVELSDFDFKKPGINLKSTARADTDTSLEVYDYPGEYKTQEEGKTLTKVRLEELRATQKTGLGHSICNRLIPGFRFTMKRHPRSEFNQEYLIIKLIHSGTQLQAMEEESPATGEEGLSYENEFHCIPFKTPYRPPRVTDRPFVHGTQTAIIVGPSGEEIYTDEHGRVKVQFHWDREGKKDEKSSCWIRVSQNWAGKRWGAMFIPRIGQEVIVDFIEGDPDQPIITGRVYNGENPVPYSLPADKTRSTIKSDSSLGGGGSNELRFEDAAGSEEIYLHGQKDWTIAIDNDKNQTIGNDETLDVGNNRTKSVGADQSETIGANKTIKVGTDHSETIGANKTLNVGSNHTETIGANMSVTVGSNNTITIGSNKTETISIACAESIGAAKALSIGGAYQVSVGAVMNETVGGAKMEEIGGLKMETIGAKKVEVIGSSKSVKTGSNLSETIGGGHSEKVTKEYSLKAKKVIIQADDEITFKTGSATINMKKNGDIQIKGKNIEVKGSGKINIKASSDVKIKGSKTGIN